MRNHASLPVSDNDYQLCNACSVLLEATSARSLRQPEHARAKMCANVCMCAKARANRSAVVIKYSAAWIFRFLPFRRRDLALPAGLTSCRSRWCTRMPWPLKSTVWGIRTRREGSQSKRRENQLAWTLMNDCRGAQRRGISRGRATRASCRAPIELWVDKNVSSRVGTLPGESKLEKESEAEYMISWAGERSGIAATFMIFYQGIVTLLNPFILDDLCLISTTHIGIINLIIWNWLKNGKYDVHLNSVKL